MFFPGRRYQRAEAQNPAGPREKAAPTGRGVQRRTRGHPAGSEERTLQEGGRREAEPAQTDRQQPTVEDDGGNGILTIFFELTVRDILVKENFEIL